MWLTSRYYGPLLPATTSRAHRTFSNTLASRGKVFVLLVLVAVVIIGVARVSDFHIALASKLQGVKSPEIFPNGSESVPSTAAAGAPLIPTYAQTEEFYKEHLSPEEMKGMVSQTKGFFTRDYSLALGWNNVRYILEAAVIQARILNRTLILPSFIYARSCAYELSVCADQAPMLNRNDAIGMDIWRNIPIDQQMGWQIPVSMMINITQLRRFQPVVTTAEYLRYAGLPPTLETTSGFWDRNPYHQSSDPFASHVDRPLGRPTLFVIRNPWYDSEGVTRVDIIPDDMKERSGWIAGNASAVQASSWENYDDGAAQLLFEDIFLDKNIVEWDEARRAIGELATRMPEVVGIHTSPSDLEDDEFIEDVLNRLGWEVLYTFRGAVGMDHVKHVVLPMRQAARRTSLRGFLEDYAHVDADVVVLEGETHLYRKPGQMRFTTPSMRELFQSLVVHHVVPPDRVYELARKFDLRIAAINDGRQWMAAHIRRGDFVSAGWAWGGDSHEDHLERIKQHLDEGRKLLHSEHSHKMYSVPDITPDSLVSHRELPTDGDKFFIATDETDPKKLDYFSENGAIMFRDLVTFEDRHEFGWGILFSDIIGLVEQATLARASYFYGAAMSSFTGGVFNMRAVLGAEEDTALAD